MRLLNKLKSTFEGIESGHVGDFDPTNATVRELMTAKLLVEPQVELSVTDFEAVSARHESLRIEFDRVVTANRALATELNTATQAVEEARLTIASFRDLLAKADAEKAVLAAENAKLRGDLSAANELLNEKK
jgi:hypothetical protein